MRAPLWMVAALALFGCSDGTSDAGNDATGLGSTESRQHPPKQKVTICHAPHGCHEPHTLVVSAAALPAHLAHGDTQGPCEDGCRSNDDCDDGNACTTDACGDHACQSIPVSCDDGDPCTSDSCNASSGCVHEPAPECACRPRASLGCCGTADVCSFDSCGHQEGVVATCPSAQGSISTCAEAEPGRPSCCKYVTTCQSGDVAWVTGRCQPLEGGLASDFIGTAPYSTLRSCQGSGCSMVDDVATCGCQPSCAPGSCGPDGCGGVCGDCRSADRCSDDGTCVRCDLTPTTACCGNDVCPVDACGRTGAPVACGGTCVDGVCQACAPSCNGRDCGPDGCGGSCGSCSGGATCSTSGTCECAPRASFACCGAEVCSFDACGGEEGVVASCARSGSGTFGCRPASTPQCCSYRTTCVSGDLYASGADCARFSGGLATGETIEPPMLLQNCGDAGCGLVNGLARCL